MAKKALKTPDNNDGVRKSTRVKYPVQRLTYDGFVAHHYAYMVRVVQEVEPICFEQAIGNPKWDNAMDEEMAALDVNATWELVALPKDKKAIGCKWVYKVKHNPDGSVSRYKARLVAKGYDNCKSNHCYGISKRMDFTSNGCKKCFSSWRFIGRSVHGTTTKLCGPNTS
jgi:hypothetical protein